MTTILNRELFEAYKAYISVKNYDKAWECLYHMYKEDRKSTYPIICNFRDSLNRNSSLVAREILKRAYDLTGRDYFDDFMIALEWNRPLDKKFWLPRRSKLMLACNKLQELEEDKLDELFLSMPPRVGKTTIVMMFMLWVMLRDSERSNLYSSFSDTVASTFYTGLLELLTDSETYRWKQIFPECSLASTNARDNLINIDRKKKYASFTSRSLYGTLNGAVDCNGYMACDDLISGIEEAMNKDRLNSAWAKVDNNLLPRGKQGTKKLWIGTRWSMIDPIARRIDLLENDPRCSGIRYSVINFPALDKDDESNFEYACEVGFNTDYFHQRRASFERNGDIASWLAQYMGEPVERDGSVFSPDEMQYYNGELPTGIDPDRVFIAVDPAWGGGDYVAAPVCYQYNDTIYIHDVIFDNSDKRVTIPKIISAAIENEASAIFVEATKMTSGYTEEINTGLREKNKKLNVQSTTKHWTGKGKEQRIFDLAPNIRETMVFRQSGCRSKEYEQFMQNVFSFTITGKAKHDDAPDSLCIALSMALFSATKIEIKSRRF